MPNHYIKYKEPVFDGYENFSFLQINYEITDRDLQWLEQSGLQISADDFERVVDVFEKITVVDNNQSLNHLQTKFSTKVPQEITLRITPQVLENIYQKVSHLPPTLFLRKRYPPYP